MMPAHAVSPRFADYRRHVDELVSATVAAVDPQAAVGRFLWRDGRSLWIGQGADAEAIDLDRGRLYLIAAGKAAIPMTTGALAVLGSGAAGGAVVTGAVIAKAGGPEWPVGADRWPERKWAEKALAEGVDGLICVNRRAGGHAGRCLLYTSPSPRD